MALALVVLSARTARACDTAATARRESTCVVLDRQGVKGVWFSLATANELRAAFRLVPELQLQLETYSEMDDRRTREVGALREALDTQKGVSSKLKEQAALSAKEARAAEAEAAAARTELDRWWRGTIVWLSIGALAGALAGIAIATR